MEFRESEEGTFIETKSGAIVGHGHVPMENMLSGARIADKKKGGVLSFFCGREDFRVVDRAIFLLNEILNGYCGYSF